MNQKEPDQEWQRLQTRIEGFLHQALGNDVRRIEYRPQCIGLLPEMPSGRHQNVHADGAAIIASPGTLTCKKCK